MLDELSVDFPGINPAHAVRAHRYSYFAAFPDGALQGHALVRYDMKTGARQVRELAEGRMPSEPSFAADPRGGGEDDGWLLCFVSDLRRGKSELLILDAHDIRRPPVATVEIPAWVPGGVHGAWVADTDLSRT